MMAFRKFRSIKVVVDPTAKTNFLKGVGEAGTAHFRDQMVGPKSGRMYRYRGKPHRASAPDEYPANMSGALRNSIDYTLTNTSVTIGTDTPYAGYLAEGTTKMSARRMSKEAMMEAIPTQISKLRRAVRFQVG